MCMMIYCALKKVNKELKKEKILVSHIFYNYLIQYLFKKYLDLGAGGT